MRIEPLLLVAGFLNLVFDAHARCDHFSNITFPFPAAPPHSFKYVCLGVVRYSYFVPAGKDPADLNADAVARLTNPALRTLPTQCQTSVLEMVCGSIYLQCDPGGNYDLYTPQLQAIAPFLPIPLALNFKRPCKSLCTTATSDCLGMLKLMASGTTCDDTMQWIPVAQVNAINAALTMLGQPANETGIAPIYDDRNNNTYCNMVEGSMKIVGPNKELYQGQVCSDYISSDIFIPPGQSLSLAPLQPAGVIQTLIENQLATAFNNLPVWVASDCVFNLRRLFCTSSFMKPEVQNYGEKFQSNLPPISAAALTNAGFDGAAIFAHIFYLPQYPHLSFCEEYNDKCRLFKKAAKNVQLDRDCSAEENGIKKFPDSVQALSTVSTSVTTPLGEVPVNFQFTTEPNDEQFDYEYETVCPQGFVVPDNPYDEDIKWAKGTGCATGCASPIWSPDEWDMNILASKICTGTALILGVIQLCWWTYDKAYKKRPLPYIMVINVLFMTVPYGIGLFMSYEAAFCRDNANGLDESDGFTFCYYAALSIWYFGLVTVLNWLFIATDIYVRVVVGHKRPNSYLKYYIPCMYLLPIPVVIAAVYLKIVGYDKIRTYCFLNDDKRSFQDLYLWYYPTAACCLIGAVEMCCVYRKIWEVTGSTNPKDGQSSSSGTGSFLRKLRPLFVPIKFVVLFLVIWLALVTVRVITSVQNENTIDNVKDWANCIFQHFDGDDETWFKACGETPSERVAPATGVFIMAAATSGGVIIFLVFMLTTENFKRLFKTFRSGKVYVTTERPSKWSEKNSEKYQSSTTPSGNGSVGASSSAESQHCD